MLHAIEGVIDRRILVNYRIDAEVLARLLPSPFRPKLHRGHGIGGVCLIRLKYERPPVLPARFGFTSENAAHRFAVEWDGGEGVYIPRRDTSSCLATLSGGCLFPGSYKHAYFEVDETDCDFSIFMKSKDCKAHVEFKGCIVDALPEDSIFSSLHEASAFFEKGGTGYSSTRNSQRFDGIQLVTKNWTVQPLQAESVRSSLFEDASMFPASSASFDHALLMRGIEHQWQSLDQLCCNNFS